MTQPSERKEAFRLLRSHEVEDAIQTIRENPALRESLRDNGAGIRLLVEEPGLYNKWLYTIPDAQGRHRLVGLSKRFCPFDNRHYAGGTLYHSGLDDVGWWMRRLKLASEDLCGEPLMSVEVIFRGFLGKLTPDQRTRAKDWVSAENWSLMERELAPEDVAAERERVRWKDEMGPVWQGEDGVRVEVAHFEHAETLFAMQTYLKKELGLDSKKDQNKSFSQLRAGIQNILCYLKRHRFLALFTNGSFLILRRRDGPVDGCLWCYRSFHPLWAGWTIWIRRPYIRRELRGQGFISILLDAAVGIFAEAGFPSRLRAFVANGVEGERAQASLGRIGFQPVSDDSLYWLEIPAA